MSNRYTQGTDQPSDGKKAVALLYDQLRAPVIKAKGEGELAWEILRLAEEHGVHAVSYTHLTLPTNREV